MADSIRHLIEEAVKSSMRERNKERKRDEPKKDVNEGPFSVPALLFVAA